MMGTFPKGVLHPGSCTYESAGRALKQERRESHTEEEARVST